MNIRTRHHLFNALLVSFFVIGAILLLYVNGWRFDFKTFRPMKVGAIFVRSFPPGAQISLDKKTVKNDSGFFQSGTLINGLFPKTYALDLSANGYEPWHENITVSPALVAEAKYAVLIPKNAEAVTTSTTEHFWILGSDLVVEKSNGALMDNGEKLGVTGEVMGWTSNFENILTYDQKTGVYAWNSRPDNSHINVTSLLKKVGFNLKRDFKITVDPENNKKMMVVQSDALYTFDTGSGKLTAVRKAKGMMLDNAIASTFLFAWTEFNPSANTSTLVVYDKFLGKAQSDSPTLKGKIAKIQWVSNNRIGILQNDGAFSLYDLQKDETTKIADDVKDFVFTENGGAVAALEHSALEVFVFNQDKDYYRFRLPGMDSIQSISWYGDGSHLFVSYPENVRFLDLKDSALKNLAVVRETSLARYNQKDNTFYFTSAEGLKRLVFSK